MHYRIDSLANDVEWYTKCDRCVAYDHLYTSLYELVSGVLSCGGRYSNNGPEDVKFLNPVFDFVCALDDDSAAQPESNLGGIRVEDAYDL
mmetsp:Transcript_24949/g.53841  ORF Transcript_24949/g.53841 Transcript_24949/m.53841 type:complete len:90 (+) Transcript_24949:1841-2110(+)|eukprot:CAMPEP_0203788474 /NCGR_PEP_ID=MMETSP0100_2-20121128/2870_1 /ASSEMBLY_ACC=CAM_ASM_000210 /TAXON_ID=96639 /ORGANISM=" , Strain NY0313808BC1" /LENGTH=89 /DNA_ID=CAMNT_0050691227 /DNA_START=445 /DNA_END=714 /DNA_ORIENTATION=+